MTEQYEIAVRLRRTDGGLAMTATPTTSLRGGFSRRSNLSPLVCLHRSNITRNDSSGKKGI